MQQSKLRSIEAKAFVPARDFELSKKFYEAIGFTLIWSTPQLAYFLHDTSAFLLQDFYVKEHTDNFKMHLLVDDVDAWWKHISPMTVQFQITVEEPSDKPWGMRDFALVDPSGVMWRIGQTIASSEPAFV
jgi:catechol 2,3-dioxygenase-like lactoylglutathione lyase family enzyme